MRSRVPYVHGHLVARLVTLAGPIVVPLIPLAMKLQADVQTRIEQSPEPVKPRRKILDNPMKVILYFYIALAIIGVLSPLIFGLLGQQVA
jgi:hypothetical protein